MDKVIDIEERIPSMRERRRKRTNRKFLFLLFIFAAALLLVLYFQSHLSKIRTIEVSETKLNASELYKDKSGLTEGDSLWGFQAGDIESKLKKISGVRDVEITREKFRDVRISVSEWRHIAYIQEGEGYSLLLENGVVFPREGILPDMDAPILNGFPSKKELKRMTNQLVDMDKGVYELISEIVYTGDTDDSQSVTVYMDDGYEVRAFIPGFASKMKDYPNIVAQLKGMEKGVIDMEVGTFFTPYSELYKSNEELEEEGTDDDENEEG